MGEVYKAIDTRLDRTVAVKVLPEYVAADPDLKQRFEREAKTLAALSHPHICNIHDVGNHDGVDFLVMEYLDGETLEQRLKKGALPLDQALQIGIQIADALAAAHRASIVHHDVKPGNVVPTKSAAKLLDFGLAKGGAPAVAGSLSMLPTTPPNLTQHGSILGAARTLIDEGHQVVLHARSRERASALDDRASRAAGVIVGDLGSAVEIYFEVPQSRGRERRRTAPICGGICADTGSEIASSGSNCADYETLATR
jgi:serine/threonine protein kinase